MRGMDMREFVKNKVEELLSKEFYCSPKVLNENVTIHTINFEAKQPYIKILAYRNCVVVCTSESIHSKVRKLLQNKTRDEIFEVPFVYGQTIHYVPDEGCTEDIGVSSNYEYEVLFDRDILELNGLTGFENSLAFDEKGFTVTKAVYVARDNNKIIGVAGAAESPVDGMWEVGVDVMEGYRNARLGTYLVRKLTKELLARNIVPFYSASITNIGSQMVANKSGYIPYWVDTFGNVWDGSSVYNNLVEGLISYCQ